LLQRYSRLSREYGVQVSKDANYFLVLICSILALPGWILNFIPYHLCDVLIRVTRKDASDAATFKVIYSLFLFPAFYFLEGFAIHKIWGFLPTILFVALILPASYFTLYCMDWYEQRGAIFRKPHAKATAQLIKLREKILEALNSLAARTRG
jgi:hypothetical protein